MDIPAERSLPAPLLAWCRRRSTRQHAPASQSQNAALAEFSEEAEPSNLSLREQRRREERKTAARLRLGEVEKRGMTRAAKHLNKRLAA